MWRKNVREESWWWSVAGQPHSRLSAEDGGGLREMRGHAGNVIWGRWKMCNIGCWSVRDGMTNGQNCSCYCQRYHLILVLIWWQMVRSYPQFWTKDASITQFSGLLSRCGLLDSIDSNGSVGSKFLCYWSVFLLFLMMCTGVPHRTVCPSAMHVAR